MIKNLSKIIKIIGKKNTLLFLTLIPSGFISVVLEFLSIASFLPLMQQIFSSENISTNNTLFAVSRNVINYFDNINVLIIVVLCLFVSKNIYITFQNYYFLTITQKIYIYVCNQIFLSKISEDYLSFIGSSSSNFLKDLRESSISLRLYIESIINFFIEILVMIFVLIFLLIMNFEITSKIFIIFGFFVFLFTTLTKNYAKLIGRKQNNTAEIMNNTLINSYHNFTDIKLYGQSNFFLDKYKKINTVFASYTKRLYFLFSLPKVVLESTIILTLIFYFSSYSEFNIKLNLGILGIYLISLYRILPSAVRISNLKVQLSSHSFSINLIWNILKRLKTDKYKKLFKIKSKIELKNVSFSYDGKIKVVKDLNLIFKTGKITCIYGESGGGKTTLIRLLTGLLQPNLKGKILYDNKKINVNNKLDISYVSQNFFIMKDTLINNIVFNNTKEINYEKLDKVLEIVDLKNVFKKKNIQFDSVISENASLFSGGQRQRIAIARALYNDSNLIVFDESTNALDLKLESKILKNLHQIKKDKIIIIISHRKETKKNCDLSYHLL